MKSTIIGVSGLLVALSFCLLSSGVVYYLYRIESNKQERLDQCLALARSDYEYNWDGFCKREGREEGCEINFLNAGAFNNQLEEDRQFCYSQLGNL